MGKCSETCLICDEERVGLDPSLYSGPPSVRDCFCQLIFIRGSFTERHPLPGGDRVEVCHQWKAVEDKDAKC